MTGLANNKANANNIENFNKNDLIDFLCTFILEMGSEVNLKCPSLKDYKLSLPKLGHSFNFIYELYDQSIQFKCHTIDRHY